MDELAFSLTGKNVHYGTPVNPACPDRLPGGSSAGTAAAVAAGDADIGLGGDTAGRQGRCRCRRRLSGASKGRAITPSPH